MESFASELRSATIVPLSFGILKNCLKMKNIAIPMAKNNNKKVFPFKNNHDLVLTSFKVKPTQTKT